jgi:hypothetical protein
MNAYRVGMFGAVGTLLGIVLSGPLAMLVVNATHPQPSWQGAQGFSAHYHAIQIVPYLGGIVLVTALVVLVSSIHAIASADRKALSGAALAFAAAFAALVFLNYGVQTTFVPTLVAHPSENAALIAAFAMSNPTSLAWAIEMWGWALLGVATWLLAPVFQGNGLERATAGLYIANGPVSIVGALWTVLRPGWVMTPAGLVAFSLWNLLLAVLALLSLLVFRQRARRSLGAEAGPRALRSGY